MAEEKLIKNDIETNDYSEYGNVIYKSLKNGKIHSKNLWIFH